MCLRLYALGQGATSSKLWDFYKTGRGETLVSGRKKEGGIAGYLLVSALVAERLHGLPGLVWALGNPGRSVMNITMLTESNQESSFTYCREGARLDPPGWPVMSIKITLYLSVLGLWEREKWSGALGAYDAGSQALNGLPGVLPLLRSSVLVTA